MWAAVIVVGVSFGAVAVDSGLGIWLPIMMSLVVFAGASQFLFVALIASGASPVMAVLAGLIVNSRHLPFGLALGDTIGARLRERLVGAHVMTDESVGFAIGQTDPARRHDAYWLCGAGLFISWNLGTIAGAFAGDVIADTSAIGLDAAFPAVLVALVVPALRDATTRRAAVIGAVLAVAATPVLPAGLPILLALAGLAVFLAKPVRVAVAS